MVEQSIAVRHTGIFTYCDWVGRKVEQIEDASRGRGMLSFPLPDRDALHRYDATRHLGQDLMAALADGRRYVTHQWTETERQQDKTVRSTCVMVLLLDPHDAQPGEFVAKTGALAYASPQFIFTPELGMTVWKQIQYAYGEQVWGSWERVS